jgi:thiamine pyrophosphate-dependent acetolactate synthase large subunit-like protein
MSLTAALEVLRALRREEIVVTTMGTAREWPKLSEHPLDFHYIPSAMGHAPMLGLGLALARPDRETIVLNGDGCMLMSLGCLVTIAASGARNLTLVIIENGLYEVTGGQRTAAVGTGVDFAQFAQAAGFSSIRTFAELDSWRQQAAEALALPGPRCIVLQVEPVGEAYHLEVPGPMAQRITRFRAALGTDQTA